MTNSLLAESLYDSLRWRLDRMRYRIFVTVPRQNDLSKESVYYLQVGYPEPKRTLLASSFIWVSLLSNPTEFTDKAICLKWFTLIAKQQHLWRSIGIEEVA